MVWNLQELVGQYKIESIKERLEALSQEEQRIYIRGRLDEMGFYGFLKYSGVRPALEKREFDVYLNQTTGAFATLMHMPELTNYLLCRMGELGMEESEIIRKGLEERAEGYAQLGRAAQFVRAVH